MDNKIAFCVPCIRWAKIQSPGNWGKIVTTKLCGASYMNREKFETLVRSAIANLPPEFHSRLENVDVIVEDRPTSGQLKELKISYPGQLLGLYQGVILKHFTARDIISRWDVLEAHSRATSHTASGFIDTMLERMPFPIKTIQVDGGSEFQDAFEEECQRRGIRLFVLPPRSPKLNGHVERAQRTHTEEFYEVTDTSFALPELNRALLKWEKVYNTVRPHQALEYLTPQEFLEHHQQNQRKEKVSLIT